MDFKKINNKKTRKISSWIAFGFLIVVLIFILFPLLPIQNNYSLKMVTSGSMSPTIQTGGMVMVKPVSSYKVGDIITFKVGSGERDIVTHRIVERRGDEFVTQGDANNVADINLVKQEQILGKILLTIPYAGYVAGFAQSKMGFILFIIIPALLIIGNESLKIFKEIQKARLKKTEQIGR